jgi:hypothetical protein
MVRSVDGSSPSESGWRHEAGEVEGRDPYPPREGRECVAQVEAGEGSTFAHFLTPWGMMLEFVSFPNGRKYIENRDQLLWSPVNAAA